MTNKKGTRKMKKYKLNKIKFARFIFFTIIILLLTWIAISYGEIIIKNVNMNGNIHYMEWNFFNLMTKLS